MLPSGMLRRVALVKTSNLTQLLLFAGPSDWPGMCQSGTRQSPIDLDPERSVPGHFTPLVLLNYDRELAGNITNNGHTGKSASTCNALQH
jgi:carbonic anhydrase